MLMPAANEGPHLHCAGQGGCGGVTGSQCATLRVPPGAQPPARAHGPVTLPAASQLVLLEAGSACCAQRRHACGRQFNRAMRLLSHAAVTSRLLPAVHAQPTPTGWAACLPAALWGAGNCSQGWPRRGNAGAGHIGGLTAPARRTADTWGLDAGGAGAGRRPVRAGRPMHSNASVGGNQAAGPLPGREPSECSAGLRLPRALQQMGAPGALCMCQNLHIRARNRAVTAAAQVERRRPGPAQGT